MMDFVSLSNRSEINIICAREPIKSAMNQNIMHQEVRKTIEHDAHSDKKTPIKCCHRSEYNQQAARDRENEKKRIILLKETSMWLMMILVKIPH
jgi:hypothetical protein